ncbi:MAG TPA: lipoyl synthase [Terriglobia bacterium]|nr:lipoyl synthase [Terriglobia bacterium]
MEKRPDWLKVRIPSGDTFFEVRRILQSHKLNTICEDAMCPNIAECWGTHRTATFMILGDICTRACAFCAVTSGKPTELDLAEPARVAAAIAELRLRHAVITSVDRDDLADGGASVFADLVGQIRRCDPEVKIELLTPDFQGSLEAVRLIVNAGPDIFSHNIETSRRLYPSIRFKSDYDTSFGLLKSAKQMNSQMFIKTGIMVGLGEETREVLDIMRDAVSAGVDIFTIGQYLRPSAKHAEIRRYYHPDEFAEFREFGKRLGLRWVFAGPLVRSSYHAEDVFSQATAVTTPGVHGR